MFGLLSLHKPSGPTSRDCVNHIQRLVKPAKVGHAGTLDPLASGVLIVLIGNAVRLTDEYHELDKEYVGSFQLGRSSPSADIETPCVPLPHASIFSLDALRAVVPQFLGEISQVPPAYSAVRIDGERAYDLARSGKTIEMPSRRVHISSIDILSLDVESAEIPTMTLRIVCSTGTYIRSLGRDIARALGSDAVMSALERTRVGPFRSQDATSMTQLSDRESITQSLISPQSGLKHLPQIALDDAVLNRFRMGQKVDSSDIPNLMPTSNALAIDSSGRLRALIQFVHHPTAVAGDGLLGYWRTEKYFND